MKKCIATLLTALLLLCGCDKQVVPESRPHSTTTGEDILSVHYIDVGQADCALLESGGEYMLIDGGNVADSDLVVAYLQKYGVEELKTVICTHPHEDHVGGLNGVLAVYPVKAVYSPTTTYSSKCYDNFMHYVDQQGLEVTIPKPGDKMTLGNAEITVLGPLKSYAKTNDTSIVVMVDFGSTSFLFTGDMEREAEKDLIEYDWDLKADVLKVGHHGSSTSTTYGFLREVDPDYAVISCGKDNDYGHPNEEVISRLADADVTTYRTDELGTVIAVSDGTDITFTWEKTQNEPQNAEHADVRFVGNINSKKFHTTTCSNLPGEKNRIYFDSYEDAVKAGYTPCGTCLR